MFAGANVIKQQESENTKQTQLHWFDENGYTDRYLTKAEELNETTCPNSGFNICERGYDDNDFVVFGDPSSPLKSGATPNEVIMKP